MKKIKVKISEIKLNENNPRIIKDDKFFKLVESIKNFPEMLGARPIVVNKDMVVLGGNMRLRALKEAKTKEIEVIVVDWDQKKQDEFVIKDNANFGDWDWDALANEWETTNLVDWGVEIPEITTQDYSEKNKEIDVDKIDGKMVIKLEYTEDDFKLVSEKLFKIAPTAEMAVWKLLEL